jgi:hydroxymethylbilane synthase
MPKLTIATRGSSLALAQAEWVAAELKRLEPGLLVELDIIKTKGDKILDVPLAKVGGKGLFVKEIEDALLAGRAQLAVHSMKDMPAELPEGLVLASISRREDPRDVFVSADEKPFDELPLGARVGTSSLRRQSQLLARRPDLVMSPIRGNVGTRLKKIKSENLAGVVLAAAGINRLGLDIKVQHLEPELMLPAVGQGALGMETRADDEYTNSLVARLNHPETASAVTAERAFLARLEGGCQVPIAGYATVQGGRVKLSGLVASLDGARVISAKGEAETGRAGALGVQVADEVLQKGGKAILDQVYGEVKV